MATRKLTRASVSSGRASARPKQHLQSETDTQTGSVALCEDFELAVHKFRGSLGVKRAAGTVDNYTRSATKLLTFLQAKGMKGLQAIRREHVEMWLVAIRASGVKPASLRADFAGAQQFFKYLHEDGEITSTPMAKISPPKVPEQTTPILRDEDIDKLLAVCKRDKTLWGLRDRAIILTLRWGGLRSMELRNANIEHIEWRDPGISITRKGGNEAFAPLTPETMRAINVYLNRRKQYERRKSEWDRSDALFISHQGGGRIGKSGLYLMLRRRAQEAGLDPDGFRPHALRHTWATALSDSGVQEGELRRLGGWTPGSRMVERYTKQTATKRAIASYRKATSKRD
ncbi:MAG: tyrosine-type recombinase/integrase [Dehalococcoidia bacterium]